MDKPSPPAPCAAASRDPAAASGALPPASEEPPGTMSKSPVTNLQDAFLTQVRQDNVELKVLLVNGVQLRGTLKGFDNFTLVLSTRQGEHMVYKHAIAQLVHPREGAPDDAGPSHDPAQPSTHGGPVGQGHADHRRQGQGGGPEGGTRRGDGSGPRDPRRQPGRDGAPQPAGGGGRDGRGDQRGGRPGGGRPDRPQGTPGGRPAETTPSPANTPMETPMGSTAPDQAAGHSAPPADTPDSPRKPSGFNTINLSALKIEPPAADTAG